MNRTLALIVLIVSKNTQESGNGITIGRVCHREDCPDKSLFAESLIFCYFCVCFTAAKVNVFLRFFV